MINSNTSWIFYYIKTLLLLLGGVLTVLCLYQKVNPHLLEIYTKICMHDIYDMIT